MRPMYGGMQMTIVTMPRITVLHIIKSGKVGISWVIARVQEECHNCDKGNNATKPCILCGATDHLAVTCSSEPVCTQYKAISVNHGHRSGNAKYTALAKARKGG